MPLKIRPLRPNDSAKAFHDFICELIEEKVYIQIDKKPTLRWEREWLKSMKKSVRDGEAVWLGAWEGKKLVASAQAKRGLWNERNNAAMGIGVRKTYRGQGLGEKLLRGVIALAKKRLKPENIYLLVAAPNKPARALYKKIGFRTWVRFPRWARRKEGYIDVLYMILQK